jgi:hypothetical protein
MGSGRSMRPVVACGLGGSGPKAGLTLSALAVRVRRVRWAVGVVKREQINWYTFAPSAS